LFLALYNEFTARHLHAVSRSRPSCRDRLAGWEVYTTLFDVLLSEGSDGLLIIPEWAFDIMHEFVYQFQGFCQYRTSSSDKRKEEDWELLRQNQDAWTVSKVMFYLHSFMEAASSLPENIDASSGKMGIKNLGIFAAVALSRLECLLADYTSCLDVLEMDIVKNSLDDGAIGEVFQAKISLAYHAGVAFLMLNRYKDAISVLEDICSEIQRATKSGQLAELVGSDQQQFQKQFDRMLALLAILVNICPASTVLLDGRNRDSVGYLVRDKFGSQLLKIDGGEEGYDSLFGFACPKFIDPAVPDYSKNLPAGLNLQTYNLQILQFINEMEKQRSLKNLHSYMKLYTSIGVEKLASFNDCSEVSECVSQLLSLKHKMLQREGTDNSVHSALDIHYFGESENIYIDEAQTEKRFEGFFLSRISHSRDIQKAIADLVIE